MGTAPPGSACSPVTPRKLGRTLSPCTTWSIHGAVRMAMARYLARGQRRAADSAGKTRSCPPQTAPAAGSGRPHDVRKGIIRRQGGRLPRCSIQRVRMGLRVTDGAGGCGRLPDTRSPATKTARGIPRTSHCMSVAGQLLYRERGLADSAGNTRPSPSTPRLPGLRRGSHNVRRSTAEGCLRPRS